MLCTNGYAAAPVTKWYTTYFEFNENKVVYTFKNPFFIFNVTDAKINDNVFYANYSGGVDQTEHPWWDNLWFPDTTYGVIALQPLSEDSKAMFNPGDPEAAEGLRKVEVMNNTYFWPQEIQDMWANWNATQANWIRTPMWMNERTEEMFADDANYPFLVESGNVNVDPQYNPQINQDVLNGTTGNDIGFLAYFEQIRGGTAATDIWGFGHTQVGEDADWIPPWPLPEEPLLVSDVEPNGRTANLPADFRLLPNYPNPFNPVTTIAYEIAKTSDVNLSVYNLLGQKIRTLVSVQKVAGSYSVQWDGRDNLGRKVASGVYLYKLTAGEFVQVNKMLLTK